MTHAMDRFEKAQVKIILDYYTKRMLDSIEFAPLPGFLKAEEKIDKHLRDTAINKTLECQDKLAKAVQALELVLPLAKGYAHAHPEGSNQKYVECAIACLAEIQGEDVLKLDGQFTNETAVDHLIDEKTAISIASAIRGKVIT